MSRDTSLSISRLAVPSGSPTPSPTISLLTRCGEKIRRTWVGDPLSPMVSSLRLQLLVAPERHRGVLCHEPPGHGGIAQAVDLPRHGDQRRQRRLHSLDATLEMAPDPHLSGGEVQALDVVHQRELRVAQSGGDARPHLGSVAVDGLFAAEHQPHLFPLGQLANGLGEDHARGQGVRPGEGPVAQEHARRPPPGRAPCAASAPCWEGPWR